MTGREQSKYEEHQLEVFHLKNGVEPLMEGEAPAEPESKLRTRPTWRFALHAYAFFGLRSGWMAPVDLDILPDRRLFYAPLEAAQRLMAPSLA